MMSGIVPLDRFLADLPEFVSGITNVVIATYNNLDSHPDGGEFYADERKVSILCGGASYANVEIFIGGSIPNEGAQATKAKGVQKVSASLTHVVPGSLVILYAGISCLNEVVGLGYRIAKRGVKVALVSCGCDRRVFSGLESNENILFVVPTIGPCNGGRGDFSRIVARLLD